MMMDFRENHRHKIKLHNHILGALQRGVSVIYKEVGYKNINLEQDTIEKIKSFTGITYGNTLTWNHIYEILHKNVNVDPIAMAFFINRFADELGKQLEIAGFTFMEKYQLTLIAKGK